MRRKAKEIIRTIENLVNEDIRSLSEMIAQELYLMGRDSRIDYIGQIKNDLQWVLIGVENAQKRMGETIELGHQIELPSFLTVEKINNEETNQYLLTENPTVYKHRITLGVFNNLEEVKEFVDNNY